jgi:predicted AAA+ superfamily ATPase
MKNYISRDRYQVKIEKYIGKEIIKVLIGQRRVGKSYLLFQIIDQIKAEYSAPNIIYINLELNEHEKLKTSGSLYNYVKSRSVQGDLNFLLIDEIQSIPEFEKVLRSLLAEGGFDIYCTGSNANLLSEDISKFQYMD